MGLLWYGEGGSHHPFQSKIANIHWKFASSHAAAFGFLHCVLPWTPVKGLGFLPWKPSVPSDLLQCWKIPSHYQEQIAEKSNVWPIWLGGRGLSVLSQVQQTVECRLENQLLGWRYSSAVGNAHLLRKVFLYWLSVRCFDQNICSGVGCGSIALRCWVCAGRYGCLHGRFLRQDVIPLV